MIENPIPEQEPKLSDQIADAWAAVLIDIYQRRKKREEAKPKTERPHDRPGRRMGRADQGRMT